MNKIFQYIAYLTIIAAFCLITLLGFWLLYPYNIISFEQTPFPILNENKTIKQGDTLVYESEYCKHLNVSSDTTRSFSDGIVYNTPMVQSNRSVGCDDVKVYIEVPKNLPPSKYTLEILYRFQVNPIRKIDVKVSTEQFLVIK